MNIFKYHVFSPMGRFQLELIYLYFPRFSIKQLLFLSCRPFVVITTLSTGLVGVEVNSIKQLLFLSCRPFVVITTLSTGVVGVEVTSTSYNNCLMEGRWKIKVN